MITFGRLVGLMRSKIVAYWLVFFKLCCQFNVHYIELFPEENSRYEEVCYKMYNLLASTHRVFSYQKCSLFVLYASLWIKKTECLLSRIRNWYKRNKQIRHICFLLKVQIFFHFKFSIALSMPQQVLRNY